MKYTTTSVLILTTAMLTQMAGAQLFIPEDKPEKIDSLHKINPEKFNHPDLEKIMKEIGYDNKIIAAEINEKGTQYRIEFTDNNGNKTELIKGINTDPRKETPIYVNKIGANSQQGGNRGEVARDRTVVIKLNKLRQDDGKEIKRRVKKLDVYYPIEGRTIYRVDTDLEKNVFMDEEGVVLRQKAPYIKRRPVVRLNVEEIDNIARKHHMHRVAELELAIPRRELHQEVKMKYAFMRGYGANHSWKQFRMGLELRSGIRRWTETPPVEIYEETGSHYFGFTDVKETDVEIRLPESQATEEPQQEEMLREFGEASTVAEAGAMSPNRQRPPKEH